MRIGGNRIAPVRQGGCLGERIGGAQQKGAGECPTLSGLTRDQMGKTSQHVGRSWPRSPCSIAILPARRKETRLRPGWEGKITRTGAMRTSEKTSLVGNSMNRGYGAALG